LAKARNERTALDSEIALLETELGIKKADEKQSMPTPAKEFQAARDAMPSPFVEVKK
jgi:hypothetical protein